MLVESARAVRLGSSLAIGLGLLVLGVTASTVMAREATEPDAARPWAWSVEDRIEKRLNPQENARRWEEFLRANAEASAADKTRIVIDGSRDPGLFLPGDLIRQLLSAAFAPESESRTSWRRIYERRFGAPLPADFWTVLEAHARDYLEARHHARELASDLSSADSSERDRILAEIDLLQLPQCQRVLQIRSKAQAIWGELFDRFLYLGVAPGMRMTTTQSRTEMEFVAAGCR